MTTTLTLEARLLAQIERNDAQIARNEAFLHSVGYVPEPPPWYVDEQPLDLADMEAMLLDWWLEEQQAAEYGIEEDYSWVRQGC